LIFSLAGAAASARGLSAAAHAHQAGGDAADAGVPSADGEAAGPPAPAAGAAAGRPLPRGLTALSILGEDGVETLGVKTPAGVVDVRSASQILGLPAPFSLDELLQDGGAADLDALVSEALKQGVAIIADEASIRHGRLFANPGKIVCVGLNYRQHAEEVGQAAPRVPILFNKYNNALAAANSTVRLPARDVAYKIDYETELLVVIGRAARDVAPADALGYVAGYAVGHDLSARDLQLELPGVQWMLGKTLDGFAPIGPYFVSADQVPNPDALKLETRVNGRLVQSSNTADFIFDVQHVVSYVSHHFTLQPGDIIFTGTPQGVIVGKAKADQHWLKAGDEVVSSIEGLGELRFELA
jgi:2-keto-4-pentenoate hydratase/2-oxohepta-3-ene-1,7-dioic acid hydratase in catechol pathway